MECLRVAIVGSGGMAHTRAANVSQDPRVQITCVGARNPVTGRTLAERYGIKCVERWEDVVRRDDVDAVFVCTHNDTHALIARAVLEAGKHVFVEYPLAMIVDSADALLRLASARGRVIHVGHDQAFVGWHLAIKEQSTSLDRLLAVNGVLATPTRGGARSLWRNRALSGPPFMVGIAYVFHLVDAFGPVKWVEGTNTYERLEEGGYYRSSVSTLHAGFTSGGVAQLLYIRGYAIPRDEQEQAMMFTNGFLSYRGYVSGSRTNEGHLTRVTHAGSQRVDFPAVTLAQAGRQNTANFLAEVLDEAPVSPPTTTARNAVAVALAAEQAAEENGRVTLAPAV